MSSGPSIPAEVSLRLKRETGFSNTFRTISFRRVSCSRRRFSGSIACISGSQSFWSCGRGGGPSTSGPYVVGLARLLVERAVGGECVDLGAGEPEDVAQHEVVVLAERRARPLVPGRGGGAEAVALVRPLAEERVDERDEVAAVGQLRVGEHVAEVLDGDGFDARGLERLGDVGGRAGRRP